MLRFQTAIASVLGTLLVVPVFVGQGEVATLQDALSGTARALEVLRDIEQKLRDEPATGLALLLSATEAPLEGDAQRDERLEALRSEVNLLQMELDARESPLTAGAGTPFATGLRAPLPATRGATPGASAGITTGLDDGLRALLSQAPATKPARGAASSAERAPLEGGDGRSAGAESAADEYSADPLRHAIACYRAGRYSQAAELLAARDDAAAMYWRARALERLDRLDEAVATMERAIAQGGDGFELRRAQTDLEFLRWKSEFLSTLPARDSAEAKRP